MVGESKRLRVVQWNTGKVGKMALRGILDDPRLELVGVFAWSADKIGKDAGAICGRPDCGVLATDDIDALVALGADVVIYAPYQANLEHLTRLLASGSNVVSTNLLANLGGVELPGDVRSQVEAACRSGNTSFYITGINPGWIDDLAITATAICCRVDSISAMESVSVAHYESIETWKRVGMSMSDTTPEVVESCRNSLLSFRDSVARMGKALAFELDEIDFVVEYAKANQTLDLGWWTIEKGTHAALRAGWDGKVGGKPVIRQRVVWFMTKDIDEPWDLSEQNYIIDVAGEPDIALRAKVKTPPHWGNPEHAFCTAMPAVSIAQQVKDAAPGILGLKDIVAAAPAGVWLGK